MTLPMEVVVEPRVAIHPSASLLASWALPVVARAALLEFGLSGDGVMTPRFQPQREPALVPNVAGELEAYTGTVLRHVARLDPGIDPRDEGGLWVHVVRDPGY